MWIIIAYVVIPLIAGVIGFKCYRKCPADKIMVVFGGTPFGKGFSGSESNDAECSVKRCSDR